MSECFVVRNSLRGYVLLARHRENVRRASRSQHFSRVTSRANNETYFPNLWLRRSGCACRMRRRWRRKHATCAFESGRTRWRWRRRWTDSITCAKSYRYSNSEYSRHDRFAGTDSRRSGGEYAIFVVVATRQHGRSHQRDARWQPDVRGSRTYLDAFQHRQERQYMSRLCPERIEHRNRVHVSCCRFYACTSCDSARRRRRCGAI